MQADAPTPPKEPFTFLDQAFLRMQENEESESLRLQFYSCFADTEMFLVLENEPQEDRVDPKTVIYEGQKYVHAYDSEERLAQAAGRVCPYLGLSGRTLAQMLAGSGVGVALNLDVAVSSLLLPNDRMVWLSDTLEQEPEKGEEKLFALYPMAPVRKHVFETFLFKLAASADLARGFWLCEAEYGNGLRKRILAVIGAKNEHHGPLAKAVQEAVLFSGDEDLSLDVLFLAGHEALVKKLEHTGMRLIFKNKAEKPAKPAPPGSDPNKPPILR